MPKIPRPEGHHTVTPGFAVPGAAKVLEFLQSAFGAKLVDRYEGPPGVIVHAEVQIGDSAVMFGEAQGGMDPMPAMLAFHVDDAAAVDATYRRALECGAQSEMEPADQFYGWRSATVRDPGGNRWTICTVVEELTREQIEERMAGMGG